MSHLKNIPQGSLQIDDQILATVLFYGSAKRETDESSSFPHCDYVAELKVVLTIDNDNDRETDLEYAVVEFAADRAHVTFREIGNRTILTIEEFLVKPVQNPSKYLSSRVRKLQAELINVVGSREVSNYWID
jgi:hypothetical protein